MEDISKEIENGEGVLDPLFKGENKIYSIFFEFMDISG